MTSAAAANTVATPSTPSPSPAPCCSTLSGNHVANASPMSTTPLRNNYAAPHTPIASVKRPRPSSTTSTTNNVTCKLSPLHPPRPVTNRATVGTEGETVAYTNTAVATISSLAEETGSNSINNNNHVELDCRDIADPANATSTASSSTWVGRQVDALFSPVLNFLHHGSSATHHNHHAMTPSTTSSEEEDVAAVTDEDVTMDDIESRKISDSDLEKQPALKDTNADHHSTTSENSEADDLDPKTSETVAQVDVEDDEDEFNPYLFIKSLPPYELVAPFRPPIALPPKAPHTPPISLILDLDETLVHCSVEGSSPTICDDDHPPPPPDLIFPVFFHGMTYQVQVRLRPHLFTFLEAIAQKFEVVVFTASQKVYADELLNLLDPENKFIHHRLFRESCLPVEGNFLKDLNVLGRDLRKTVLVDNSPHAFGYQVDNGIPIESWFEDPHDTELLKLEDFLVNMLFGVDDVRSIVRQHFQTFQRVSQA